MSLLIRLPILVAILALMILGLPLSHAQTIDDLKAGVVKIRAKTGQIGTGFLVRVEQDKVFIITAAHVIAGDSQPEVEFFFERNESVKGSVLPGAELNDDLRGLALVVVRGKVHIPDGVTVLPFGKSVDLVAGGEEALVIGHPSSGGDWAILKRHISNRIGRDIALHPNVESGFSGGPIIVGDHVVGIVMSRREGFGFGITHKSGLNYLEGFSVGPSPSVKQRVEDDPRGFQADARKKESDSQLTLPETKTGKDGGAMVLVPAGAFHNGVAGGKRSNG